MALLVSPCILLFSFPFSLVSVPYSIPNSVILTSHTPYILHSPIPIPQGRCTGIILGCIIGMCPLLWIHGKDHSHQTGLSSQCNNKD
jgi:hypothetical protein